VRARASVVNAYCHGFLSDEKSTKGQWLKQKLNDAYSGTNLKTLNLNAGPDASTITPETGVEAINEFFEESVRRSGRDREDVKIRLVGSSLGGYVAALYASRYPSRVQSLTLICPSFDMKSRWHTVWGPEIMQKWKEEGGRIFKGFNERPDVRIPYSFVESCFKAPDFPVVTCPTVILHGTQDEVVTPSVSERYIKLDNPKGSEHISEKKKGPGGMGNVMLQLVPDNHDMTTPETLKLILGTVSWQWNLEESKRSDSDKTKGKSEEYEVETKYMLSDPKACEERIQQAGGKLIAVQSFEDRYWDIRGEWTLAKRSIWLRERAGVWEVKVPTGARDPEGGEVYQELRGEMEIQENLDALLTNTKRKQPFKDSPTLKEWLTRNGFEVYARYRTRRSKYKLSDGVIGDLDATDYGPSGFNLLELEKVVGSQEEIELAKKSLKESSLRILPTDRAEAGLNDEAVRGKLTESRPDANHTTLE